MRLSEMGIAVLTRVIVVVLSVGVIIGCAARRSDFTPVFLREVAELGGKIARDEGLPVVLATWTMMKDENGFECVVSDADFDDILEMVLAVFGAEADDRVTLRRTADGEPWLLLRAMHFGVALSMFGTGEGVQMNCVRAMEIW
jgi:hypothetical protein